MIKHTTVRLERIEDNISRVKGYLGKLGEIQSSDKEVFWKALKEIINKSKEGHKEQILEILGEKGLDHPGMVLARVKYLSGCIRAYDEILGLVDKNQDACAEASARIIELQKNLEEVKANIELQ